MEITEIIDEARSAKRKVLMEWEAKMVLARHGIPSVPTYLASNRRELLKIIKRLKYPLVLKIASPRITHKADIGGVMVGLRSEGEILAAQSSILENARASHPDAEILGVTVQPMVHADVELIIGGMRDPIFGPCVMFGLGGTRVELEKDVSFRLAPTSIRNARKMIKEIRAQGLLNGFRGAKPVDMEILTDIIVKVSQLLTAYPDIAEIDINPLLAKGSDIWAADARIFLGPKAIRPKGKRKPSKETPSIGRLNLEGVFKPRSTLLVGSSSIIEKVGMTSPQLFKNIASNMRKYYSGTFKVLDIDRLKPGFSDRSEAIPITDLVVMVLPPKESLIWARRCMNAGCKGMIQITGGFSSQQRKRYLKMAKSYHCRLLGPNTIMGYMDTSCGLNTTFEKGLMPPKGSIAVICQSGGVGATLLDWATHYQIGISKFIFMGDKLDIDDINAVEFLARDKQTKVISIYMEGVKDGRRFVEEVSKITPEKPVLVLKGGVARKSVKRAMSHTASVAGSQEVFNAAFKEAGIIQVGDIQELFDLSLALSKQPPLRGNRVAIVSNVGGPAILAADAIEAEGLKLASLTKKIAKRIEGKYPGVDVLNPIDLIADARADRFGYVLDQVLNDDKVDGIMVITMLKSCLFQPSDAKVIADVAKRYDKPVIDVPCGGEDFIKVTSILRKTDIPTYNLPNRAARVMRGLYEYGKIKRYH